MHPSKIKLLTKSLYIPLLAFLVAVGFSSCHKEEKGDPRILVFSKTTGFRHASIEAGAAALMKLGTENGFKVDTTEDASKFTEANLKQYSAVVFLNTTQDVLDYVQQSNFERYIQAGGGFVGVHSATDTEYNWPWYNKLVGAYFDSHPEQQEAVIHVADQNHPSTEGLPKDWKRFDEWYNFKSLNPDVKVLAWLDEKTYKGGKNGDKHPFAWYHDYDGGRAFYTAGGHTDESYKDAQFLKHLLGGLKYAMGGSKPVNFTLAKTESVPEQNRFVKTELAFKLDEPMELAVTSDDRVFFVERKGKVKMYDPKTGQTSVVGDIPVNTKYNGGKEAEDGLLGITLDPGFDRNRQIYLFYSPVGSVPKQNISRFTLTKDNKVNLASEQLIIAIPTQRDECCHSGGSLAFDRDGNLFISAGDNTNPFASDGYSPVDERPGRSAWDAQKSSANMNDLRGKILRIHPEKNGGYTVPDGNLFPKDGSKGKPEIYAMGMRNPYRIAIDHKQYYLYWGDVGPDAGKDSLQGPRGHDEVNQARKPGFFGWPYFVGDNKAYNKVNFAANQIGAPHDPKAPKNTSPNNTGLQDLPPAQKAFIFYPYAESAEFPEVGKGGRSAMAGPTYYYDDFSADSQVKFPKYYDGKLLIYEWMRGWIQAVTLKDNGDFDHMEPVASHIKMEKPSDMEFGKDGTLYIIEYGTNWFAANDDAKLIKIQYVQGNRAPVVLAKADNNVGAAPLKVKFSSEGTHDLDGDQLSYDWRFIDQRINSNDPNPEFTFEKPGVYNATLTVTDAKGKSTVSTIEVKAGNSMPIIAVNTGGNSTFFWDNAPVNYTVDVTDKEDGSMKAGNIDASRIKVYLDYLPQGQDMVQVLGHQTKDAETEPASTHPGLELINKSDCKACHSIDKKSIGPAYRDVAKKYKEDKSAADRLARKVISGGNGVWGENMMSAHPQLSLDVTKEMVSYILTLADEKQAKESIEPVGSFTANQHQGKGEEGSYVISAYYTDKGSKEVGPLMSRGMLILRHPKVQAESYDEARAAQKTKFGDEFLVTGMTNNSYISFKNMDLTDVSKLTFSYNAMKITGTVEVRLDKPEGNVVASASVSPSAEMKWYEMAAPVNATSGKHTLYVVFKAEGNQPGGSFNLNWIYFHNGQTPAKSQTISMK
ncbi:carbohydrate-binding protein [Rhodocytophaga rosea]|uniref:Carbohydrate-binding protein n=1 Tax=Rhodocytophaga rosea TaxID=2704465 RepID=A0A6C0GIM9_9BACT|nr:ThuA domain-containing protein [Rhodocytophaga rosea]QHT67694.1 carbohydrate-binding protein [Rhodocytophaga rosea]